MPITPGIGKVLRPAIEAPDSLMNRTMAGPGQVAQNVGGSALAAFLGLPGDLANMFGNQGVGGMPGAPFIPPPNPNTTTQAFQNLLGVEIDRPESLLGEIGSPDPGDIARLAGRGLLGMTLFHGTPHKFKKFDSSAIGSGEGAQAFGHGLYFAENPGVARSYKQDLSGFDELTITTPKGKKAGDALDDTDLSVAKYLEMGENRAGEFPHNTHFYAKKIAESNGDEAALKRLDEYGRDARISYERNQGHLYEVEIPDNITDKMLDWDAPLSEQPESVMAAFDKIFGDNANWANKRTFDSYTAGEAYRLVNTEIHSTSKFDPTGAAKTSEMLNEAGIPGIRFFDGSSRSAGEGTRNIVVFNPDDITQVKRDGELVFDNVAGVRPDKVENIAGDLLGGSDAKGLLGSRRVESGDTISGLIVGENIHNSSSISASLGSDFETVGLRAIPLPKDAPPGFRHSADAIELGEQIRASGRIDPLIIVQQSDGTDYVLEGAHRIDALHYLGVDEFPALLVKDTSNLDQAVGLLGKK